jgi:hypothetical protein
VKAAGIKHQWNKTSPNFEVLSTALEDLLEMSPKDTYGYFRISLYDTMLNLQKASLQNAFFALGNDAFASA